MRLVRAGPGVRLLTVKTSIDLTERMERYSRSRVAALADEDLSGYVLKKDSPSCGLERVKVYDPQGVRARGGRGLFAAALVEVFPHVPVEAEGRLADPRLRSIKIQLVVDAAAALFVLLVATVLAVYKPRGMTPYGWRKQHQQASF